MFQCGRQPKEHSCAGARCSGTAGAVFIAKHTGAHPHSANTRITRQMTPGLFVATGGLLFQHTHSTLASSCTATGDALSCWQGSPVCLKGNAHSVWCVCVCVDHPALCSLCVFSFTTEWISRVKFHQILNNSVVGVVGGVVVSIQHLATHKALSPLLFAPTPICPAGGRWFAKGNCRC